jgi:2-oxoglutarate dehydrogenase E2 component (dihydrolipoamide succinyltransferase)
VAIKNQRNQRKPLYNMIIELKVPVIGESVTEVTLSQWLKKDGSFVNIDESLCEFESDKATLEFPAEKAGILIHVAQEGDDLKIGAVVAKIDTSANPLSPPKGEAIAVPSVEKPIEVVVEKTADKTTYASGKPSPAAGKIMRENGIEHVEGTGKDGRITKEDAAKAAAEKPVTVAPSTEKPAPKPAAAAPTSVGGTRSTRREKMSRMRRTIAKRLVSAKNNTAMLTTFNEVDMTGIMEMRAKYQDAFVKKYGVKLGFMSIFAKACAKVLLEMPEINAQIDGEEVIYHDYADISIAVSTPTGLVVPVLQNVESMNFAAIEKGIAALALKARENKLTMEEMTGGTFTITNGGVFGSMMSTPIINEPQSAILGMHNIVERPMAINGQVVIRPMMYLAMSYDHRIIDGSSSVTFLVKVKQLLEDPTKLLLDL